MLLDKDLIIADNKINQLENELNLATTELFLIKRAIKNLDLIEEINKEKMKILDIIYIKSS